MAATRQKASAAKPQKKKAGGKRPKYEDPKEMLKRIEAYFIACKGQYLTDADGQMMLDKYGRPIIVDCHPPTVTGLALAIGFRTRKSLIDYAARSVEFKEIIERAKSEVEKYCEERLFDKDGVKGAIFSLQNNFGWCEQKDDKQDALESGTGIVLLPEVKQDGGK